MDPLSFSKKGSDLDIVALGRKGGETKSLPIDGTVFPKLFTLKFKDSLRPSAKELIHEEKVLIRDKRQRLTEALTAERGKASQEVQELRQRMREFKHRFIPFKRNRVPMLKVKENSTSGSY